MAKEIHTSIRIQASAQQVWAILSNFEQYPAWNSFVQSLSGNVQPGQTINVQLVPPGGKGMRFRPKVLAFEENKGFRWLGHLGLPGIFDGEHSFEIIDNHDGSVTFHQKENFRGLLVPFLKKMLDGPTRQGFELMNAQLKAKAESHLP